jgi:hypothetical protein
MIYQEIENKVVSVLEKYNVKTIGIFGSYARGVLSPDSDSFKKPIAKPDKEQTLWFHR